MTKDCFNPHPPTYRGLEGSKKREKMIIEETINGLLFQEQRTYRIYKSEQDRTDGNFTLSTSMESKFLANKELARKKEAANDPENKFIVI